MPRHRSLLIALLTLGLAGTACDARLTVTVLGDSHSDIDRVPRHDWLPWLPFDWILNEHATRGLSCWEIVPQALAVPIFLRGDVMVVFCGTNDTGLADWDLGVTMGWIQAAVVHATAEGDGVVVVAPPPVFLDAPYPPEVRNQRLSDLRDAIYALQGQYDIEVADVWEQVWAHPDPESLFGDRIHLTPPGRLLMFGEIYQAIQRARW